MVLTHHGFYISMIIPLTTFVSGILKSFSVKKYSVFCGIIHNGYYSRQGGYR